LLLKGCDFIFSHRTRAVEYSRVLRHSIARPSRGRVDSDWFVVDRRRVPTCTFCSRTFVRIRS